MRKILLTALALLAFMQLSFSQTQVASYQADFNVNNNTDTTSAWKYYWNAPANWSAGTGTWTAGTGSILDEGSYLLMQNAGSMVTADGNTSGGDSTPDSFVRLTATGGHPGGVASTSGQFEYDRYAIASYTVSTDGYYQIANSTISHGNYSGNGIRVRVFINDEDTPRLHDAKCQSTADNIDVDLGVLNAGDRIYVAIGADGNTAFDGFTMDYDILAVPNGTVMANYQDDFNVNNNTNTSDWKYYWNQPTGWVAGSNTGDVATGEVGDTSVYALMVNAGSMVTPDGNTDGKDSTPDSFLRLHGTGGHSGGTGANQRLDRYGISAYTVKTTGNYYILNSALTTLSSNSNGLKVYIHVNDDAPIFEKALAGGGTTGSFDVHVGELQAGDVIYVAVGANASSSSDTFTMDFDIASICTPPTNDYYIADFGAVGDGTTNDLDAIQDAVSALVNDPFPANLHFESGKTYKCTGSGKLFDFDEAENKTIYGNNADIVVEPSILGITISHSKNILVKDLTFDSDPLSWTQGKVTAVDVTNKQFTVEIESGYPIPDNHTVPYAEQSWGMLWEATGYDIKNELIYIDQCQQLGGNTVKFTVRSDMQSALSAMNVNDRFTRDVYGVGGTFNNIKESEDITLENITHYATRALVNVLKDNTGEIRMNGVNMRRKPNTTRLLSGYRDGFHCKRNKVGPIIENSYIEGLCDDAINLSGGYYYVTASASSTEFTLDDIANFEVGDTLSFVNMTTGVELGETQIASLSGTTVTTTSAISGVVAGTAQASTTTFVMNLSKSNSGFIIRNNTFAGQRRYAMLIRSQNGLIENNTCTKLNSGIILSNEIASFFEGPFPANITIKDNSFTDMRGWSIFVGAKTYSATPSQLIHDIYLTDNYFGSSSRLVSADSDDARIPVVFEDVTGLELSGNTFEVLDTEFGNYQTDFDLGNNNDSDSPWKYYWNKPDGWIAGTNTGDLSTGAIGNVSSYTAMTSTGTMVTADGNTSGGDSTPDKFVRLNSTGGHPGGTGTNTTLDRYAITAYTIKAEGYYNINNSFLTVGNNKSNGVKVYVHVNSNTAVIDKVVAGGTTDDFDFDLGKLNVGDVVYVALGANGSPSFDGFTMDFDILRSNIEFNNVENVTFKCGNTFNEETSIVSVNEGFYLSNGTTASDIVFDCETSSRIGVKSEISEISTASEIMYSVFPNPSNGILNIRTDLSNYNITIVDINGKTIRNIQNSPSSVDLSALRNGMYWISISDGETRMGEMIIKQ